MAFCNAQCTVYPPYMLGALSLVPTLQMKQWWLGFTHNHKESATMTKLYSAFHINFYLLLLSLLHYSTVIYSIPSFLRHLLSFSEVLSPEDGVMNEMDMRFLSGCAQTSDGNMEVK